ncbi:MAG: hypothetical protein U0T82_11460 [Bacteroidales bacterium]
MNWLRRGYYKVRLDDDNILAELTATTRVGDASIHFPESGQSPSSSTLSQDIQL